MEIMLEVKALYLESIMLITNGTSPWASHRRIHQLNTQEEKEKYTRIEITIDEKNFPSLKIMEEEYSK
jgi:hypothetical protein